MGDRSGSNNHRGCAFRHYLAAQDAGESNNAGSGSRFNAPDAVLSQRNFGFGWRPYLNTDDDHQVLKRTLDRFLEGTLVSAGMATGAHAYRRPELGRRLVFAPAAIAKFCRLQRLVPCFFRRFDVWIVLLVRNPSLMVDACKSYWPNLKRRFDDSLGLI